MLTLVIKPESAIDPKLVKTLDVARRYASLAHINNVILHGVKISDEQRQIHQYSVDGSIVTNALTKYDIEEEFRFYYKQTAGYKRFIEEHGVRFANAVFGKQFTTWDLMDKHIYLQETTQAAWENWFQQYYFENFTSIYNEKP